MSRCEFFVVDGVRILHTDLAHCTPEEGVEALRRSATLVRAEPFDSVLSLVDVTDARYNRQAVKVLADVVRGNRPHVLATAVVGATGLRRIVLDGLRRTSGRGFELFDDVESAKRHLVRTAEGSQSPKALPANRIE